MKFRLPIPFTSADDRVVRIRLPEGPTLAGACVLLALLVALVFDFGSRADLSYYATVAQVIPIFLLAFMVESRSHLDRAYERARGTLETIEHEAAVVRELVRATGADYPLSADEHERLREAEAELFETRAEFNALRPRVRGSCVGTSPWQFRARWDRFGR